VAQIGNIPLHCTRLKAILVAGFNPLDLYSIKSSLVLLVFDLEVVVDQIRLYLWLAYINSDCHR